MSLFKRLIYLYIPALGFLGLTLIHFSANQVYRGDVISKLPPGEYKLIGRKCLVAGLSFDYYVTKPDEIFKNHELMSKWLYFDGEIDRRMIVDSESVTAVFGNKSCMVVERIKILENAYGRFTYYGTNISRVVPEGCSLKYTYRGTSYEAKDFISIKDAGPALSTDNKVEHLVYKDKEIYLLYEVAQEDFSDYGCSKKDSLVYMLLPLK